MRHSGTNLPVTQVTSCCFAGPDLDLLIISTSTDGLSPDEMQDQPTAGAIFSAVTGYRGRPGNEFLI